MGGGKRRYCRREVERKERIKRKVEGEVERRKIWNEV